MKIDLGELHQQKENLSQESQQLAEDLSLAIVAFHQAVNSTSLVGQVKDAIDIKIRNHQIPVLYNYISALDSLVVFYGNLIDTFKTNLSESNDSAVINTDVFEDLKSPITGIEQALSYIHQDVNHACQKVSHIVHLNTPKTDLITANLSNAKALLTDIKTRMEAFHAWKPQSDFSTILSQQGQALNKLSSLQGLDYTSKEAKSYYQQQDFANQAVKYAEQNNAEIYRVRLHEDLEKELAQSKYNGRTVKRPDGRSYSPDDLRKLGERAAKSDKQAIDTLSKIANSASIKPIMTERLLTAKERSQQVTNVIEGGVHLVGELSPVYDGYRVLTGKDPVTHEDANRWLALATLLPLSKAGKFFSKSLKAADLAKLRQADKLGRTFKVTSDANDVRKIIDVTEDVGKANQIGKTFKVTSDANGVRKVTEVTEEVSKLPKEVAETFSRQELEQMSKEVAEKTGGEWEIITGGTKKKWKGYKVNVKNGNKKDIVVRIMDAGSGQRTKPYFRLGIDGKGGFTKEGILSGDKAITHLDVTETTVEDILDILKKYRSE